MRTRIAAMSASRRRALCYAAFAVYAAGVALFSGPGLEHWWGAWAAGGYAAAAVIAAAARRQAWGAGLALAAACAGALALPALWLLTREPTPPDVAVVARSGVLLLHHGSPYLPRPALAAGGWLAYNPYLPVMALFGLPGALGLPGQTWPALIAVTFLLLYAAARVTLGRPAEPAGPAGPDGPDGGAGGRAVGRAGGAGRGRRGALGQAAFWLACPVMAFPLTMGITDPPVIALSCLALALLARSARSARSGGPGAASSRDAVLAAVVLGVACAMKYTAWPALAVIAVMVATRDGARSAVRFTAVTLAAAAGLVAALAPAASATRLPCCRTRWRTRSGSRRPGRLPPARCPGTCWPPSDPAATWPRSSCWRRPALAPWRRWWSRRPPPRRRPPGGSRPG